MDISFVIVNWNTRDLLRDCLQSIGKKPSPDRCMKLSWWIMPPPTDRLKCWRRNIRRFRSSPTRKTAARPGLIIRALRSCGEIRAPYQHGRRSDGGGGAEKCGRLPRRIPKRRSSAANCSTPTAAGKFHRFFSDAFDAGRQHLASGIPFSGGAIRASATTTASRWRWIRPSGPDDGPEEGARRRRFFRRPGISSFLRKRTWLMP